jgi:hypothetical protein
MQATGAYWCIPARACALAYTPFSVHPQGAHFHPQPVEEVAALFGSGLGADEKDPISAFTIYGTTMYGTSAQRYK